MKLIEEMESKIMAIPVEEARRSYNLWGPQKYDKPYDAYDTQRSDRNFGVEPEEPSVGSYKQSSTRRVYHLYINGVLWQKKDTGPVKFYTYDAAEKAANTIRSKGKKVEVAPVDEAR